MYLVIVSVIPTWTLIVMSFFIILSFFQENQNTVSDQQPEEKDKVMGTHTFQALLNTLPEKVSKHMAKNLSVPIAFVCLLHLANEKVSPSCKSILYD